MTSGQREGSSRGIEARVGFINASPLVQVYEGGRTERMGQLGAAKDEEVIRETLTRSELKIAFRAVVATPSCVGDLLNDGCQIIHYVGHGDGQHLSFESDDDRKCGIMEPLEVGALKDLLQTRHGGTKLAVISSCDSELSGEAFVKAGVPHVVAVKAGKLVSERVAHSFTKSFYGALFGQRRHEVQEAFKRACTVASIGREAGISQGQGAPFILLPRGGNHSVRILDQVHRGEFVEETLPLPDVRPRLPSARVPYLGIEAVQKLLKPLLLPSVACVTVVGERGSGKTQRVIQACKYVRERRKFDAMYFASCDNIRDRANVSRCNPCGLIGRALGMEPPPSSVQQLADFLFKQVEGGRPHRTVLLVLDGVDALVDGRHARDRLLEFAISLCSREVAYKLKLLVTSTFRLQHDSCTCFKSGREQVLDVAPLKGTDAAQLFFDALPQPLTWDELGVRQGCSHEDKLEALLKHLPGAEGHPETLVRLASKVYEYGLGSSDFVKYAASLRALKDGKCFAVWMKAIANAEEDDRRDGGGDRLMAGGARWARTNVAPLKYLLAGLRQFLRQPHMTASYHFRTGDCSICEDLPNGMVGAGDGGGYDAIDTLTPCSINEKEMLFLRKRLVREQERVASSGMGTQARGLGLDDDGDDQRAISIEAFVRFSEWWAPVMKTLSRLREDWSLTDLVKLHWFLGRNEALELLSQQEEGTFLLRFSESKAGFLVISLKKRAPRTGASTSASSRLILENYLVDVDEEGTYYTVDEIDQRQYVSYTSLRHLVLSYTAIRTLYPNIPKEQAFQEV